VKRTVFVGNRPGVWEELHRQPDLDCVLTLYPDGCLLQQQPQLHNTPHQVVSSREQTVDLLGAADFDLLVCNGFPFLLPIEKLGRPGRHFVNVHPSPLPDLRGKHPINGALLFERTVAGATMHYMTDAVDSGPIIAQRQIAITPDLDLGLLYRCVFDLEVETFAEGMSRLRKSDYFYRGSAPQGPSTYYSRTERDYNVDLATIQRDDLLRRVRAFGIQSQGVRCSIAGRAVAIFDAEPVDHPYLQKRYAKGPAGTVALTYDGRLLIYCSGGLVKIKSYRAID
jgi:methionyl-tRNA formyltransferase